MSLATSCGSSHSRKWPPTSVLFQRATLYMRSLTSRGGGTMSCVAMSSAVGTGTLPGNRFSRWNS
jgi:hypothetical protein